MPDQAGVREVASASIIVERSHQPLEDAARHGVVISQVGLLRRFHPGFAIQSSEVQPVSGPLRELLQILELRPPVAFSKGMDMVHVAKHRPSTVRESLRAHTTEVPRRHDAAVYIRHTRLDEASWLELAAALADFDCSNLTRPPVDILEQVVMNGPQMSEVEIACRHCLEKTLGNELPLRGIQRPEILMSSLLRRTVKSGG